MPRRTVWISDELDQLALDRLPDLNWSAALQAGVRALLECDHRDLTCSACGEATTAAAVQGEALGAFYRAVMFELGRHVDRPGFEGAARIVRTLAADHGVPGVSTVAVPRATRANHEARRDTEHAAAVTPLPTEAASRRRHPTARPVPADHPGPQAAPPQEHTA